MSETAFFFPFSRSLSPLSFSSQLNAKKWAVPGCQAPSERDTQGQRRLAQRRAGRNSCTRSRTPAGRARHLPKNQPLTPPAPESCPVGLENAPPGSITGRGGGKGQGEGKKKSQDLPLHRRMLNKRPGEVDYFFSASLGSFSRLPFALLPPHALRRRLPRPPPQRPGRNEPWAPSFLVLARQEAAGP